MERQLDKIYEFLKNNEEELISKRPQKNIKFHNFQRLQETIEGLKNNYYGWFNWNGLPNDLFFEIFSYLNEDDIGRLKIVCKTWKRRFLERDYGKFDEFSKSSIVAKRCLLFLLLFWSSTRDFHGFSVPVFQEVEDLEERDIYKKYDFRRCFTRCKLLSNKHFAIEAGQSFFFFDEINQDEDNKYYKKFFLKYARQIRGVPEIISTVFSNVHNIDNPNSIYILPLGLINQKGEIISQEQIEKGKDIIKKSIFASIKLPNVENSIIEIDDFIFMEKIKDRKIMFDIYCYLLEFNKNPENMLRSLVKTFVELPS